MVREGELFVSLEPIIEEAHRSGGRYQYQQEVVNSLIQEFVTEIRVICQTPSRARFQLNNGNIPLPKISLYDIYPARPGEIRPLGQCVHVGYVSDFLVIRGVPKYLIIRRDYRYQWQPNSSVVDTFITQITDQTYNQEQKWVKNTTINKTMLPHLLRGNQKKGRGGRHGGQNCQRWNNNSAIGFTGKFKGKTPGIEHDIFDKNRGS